MSTTAKPPARAKAVAVSALPCKGPIKRSEVIDVNPSNSVVTQVAVPAVVVNVSAFIVPVIVKSLLVASYIIPASPATVCAPVQYVTWLATPVPVTPSPEAAIVKSKFAASQVVVMLLPSVTVTAVPLGIAVPSKLQLYNGTSVTQLVPVPVEDSIWPAEPTPLPAVYVPVFTKLAKVPDVVASKAPVTVTPVFVVVNFEVPL